MSLTSWGTLLVSYCVDRRAVRAAVAGGSAELYFAFAEGTPLRDAWTPAAGRKRLMLRSWASYLMALRHVRLPLSTARLCRVRLLPMAWLERLRGLARRCSPHPWRMNVNVAPILFVNRQREFFFQSQLAQRTWALLREEFI